MFYKCPKCCLLYRMPGYCKKCNKITLVEIIINVDKEAVSEE